MLFGLGILFFVILLSSQSGEGADLNLAADMTLVENGDYDALNTNGYDLWTDDYTVTFTGVMTIHSGSRVYFNSSSITCDSYMWFTGNVYGGDGDHEYAALRNGGGDYFMTNGTTTVDGLYSGYKFSLGLTTDPQNGMLEVTGASGDLISWVVLNDIEIDGSGATYLIQTTNLRCKNLWVNQGTMKSGATKREITASKNIMINNTGVLGDASETEDWSCVDLTINSGGVLESTSGILTCSGNFDNDNGVSGFVHNDGEVEIDTSGTSKSYYFGNAIFYNLKFISTAGYRYIYESFTVIDTLTVNKDLSCGAAHITITMGDNAQSGTITGSADINGGNNRNLKLYGADSSYPAIIDYDCIRWDTEHYHLYLRWVDYQANIDTDNSDDYSIQLDGDCTFDTFLITSGDTLNLNSYELTSSSTVTINSGGTLVENGEIDATTFTHNNACTISSGHTFTITNTPTVSITGALTINSGGVLESSSGTLTFSGDATNNGDFVHNNGKMHFSGAAADCYLYGDWDSSDSFYDLEVDTEKLKTDAVDSAIYRIEHDLTGDDVFWLTYDNQQLLFGTDSYASQVTLKSIYGHGGDTDQYIYGFNANYPAVLNSALWHFLILQENGYSPNNGIHLKWIDIQEASTSLQSGVKWVLDGNIETNTIIGGSGATLDLNSNTMTASGAVTVANGGTLDLGGGRLFCNGTFTTTGTLISGTTSAIELTENASWSMNQNVTLQQLECNGSMEILGPAVLEFTSVEGFGTSTGVIDITGSYGNLVRITGVPYWTINADAIEYLWKYVNITHGNNTGSQPIVALGEGYDSQGSWDFQAPVITNHGISEGMFLDTRTNDTLPLDWTAEDMSFLYTMNVTITAWDGSLLYADEINASTFGETASYRWNLSRSIGDLSYGRLLINYTATDAHNPPASEKARKNADSMLCDLAGELVGKPAGKKKTDKHETNTISFKRSGPFVSDLFDIEFQVEDKGSKHVVTWTGANFKMSHWVKLDHGTSIPMRITADSIQHISSNEFGRAHFLIFDDYFYDASDFEASGGKMLLLDKGESDGKEFVTISFTHPDWKKGGGWAYIDPLTGAINSRSETYNISVGTIPELVSPGNNTKLHGDEDHVILKVRVYGAGSFSGTVSFYNGTGTLLGSCENVTNNTVAAVELKDLDPNTLYTWSAVFTVGGENFTSASWSYLTGGLQPAKPPSGPGRERYGDSILDESSLSILVFMIIIITLIVLLMKLWYGGEVNKS